MVSIVMCAYNVQSFIREALDSVLEQNYKSWELVIGIEAGCTDNTALVIDEYIAYHGIEDKCYVWTAPGETPYGYGYMLHNTIIAGSGELVAIVDADDALCGKNTLERMVVAHEQHPEASLIYSDYHECGPEMERHSGKRYKLVKNSIIPSGSTFLGKFSGDEYQGTPYRISHLKVFKRSAYDASEGIDIALRKAVDAELILLLEEQGSLVHIDGCMYLHRNHGDSITQRFKIQGDEYRTWVMEQKKGMYERARLRRAKNLRSPTLR